MRVHWGFEEVLGDRDLSKPRCLTGFRQFVTPGWWLATAQSSLCGHVAAYHTWCAGYPRNGRPINFIVVRATRPGGAGDDGSARVFSNWRFMRQEITGCSSGTNWQSDEDGGHGLIQGWTGANRCGLGHSWCLPSRAGDGRHFPATGLMSIFQDSKNPGGRSAGPDRRS